MINQFRAWDGQKMRYDVEEGTPFNDSEGAFPQLIIEITGANYGWKWMQSMGLPAKNASQIWESDIVKEEYFYKPEMSYKFSEKRTRYVEVKIPDFYKLWGERESYDDDWIKEPFWEVLGNRYENPELLELIDNS